MKRWDKYDIEGIKNYYLTQGNFVGACFLQALHIKVLELRKLRNRDVLRQEYDILDDLVETIFPEGSGNLAELILEIAELVLMDSLLEQDQKSYREMTELFSKVWDGQTETLLFILVSNTLTIKVALDEEVLVKYMNSVLAFIKMVYGYESKAYAQIYLHFLCECRYNDSTAYKDELTENYEYFKKYLEGYDCYYVTCLFSCMLIFMEQDQGEYEYWIRELGDAVAANKSMEEYPDLMCQLAYIRAIEYEKNNDSQAAVRILNKVIRPYVLPKTIQNNLFHVHILLKAAAHCNALNEYETMIQYVQKGVGICEELGENDTELYYEIYNYVGIKMLYDEKYTDAQEFYSKNCRQIKRKLGKNCENYIHYINNLGLVYVAEGRINDAMHCFDEAVSVGGTEFKELKKDLIIRNISLIESIYGNDRFFMDKYIKKYLSTDSVKITSNIGLKIHWLITKMETAHVNFDEIDMIFKELYKLYRKHELPNQFKPNFEYCIIMYQWKKGHKLEALKSSDKIVGKLGDKIYSYNFSGMAIDHIKLLVGNGDYENARTFCEKLIDYRYDEILEKGLGDITSELASLRMCISYYLNLIDRHCNVLYSDNTFCCQLTERIVNCKTIEKDIRSTIGKYDSEQEALSFKLYQFRDFRRKINALEMRKDIQKNENSDESEKKIEELNEKIFQYATELSELETILEKEIDLKKIVKKFRIREFSMPERTVAIEFFGYLALDFDASEPDYDNLSIRYICLVISTDINRITVSYAGSFNDNRYMLQEYYDCFYNGMESDEVEISEIENSFADVIFPMIEPYIEGYTTIYWGMDAEMHLIPVEWILGKKNNDIISIYTDSVKYIRNDERLDFTSLSSLIMGNPQYIIEKDVSDEYSELRCSEIECMEVARIIGGKALLGKEANQQAFNNNFDSDILHISTHGKIEEYEDLFLEKNRLKHFHILLSGYSDWYEHRKVEEYGNGAITADDISYTNMKNTKLAVIAACLSGFSNVNLLLGNVYCFRWALGIAGVHFSVTALWETDDIATSIFVVLFYRCLRKAQIGKAFHMAKIKLQNITRAEIKSDKILQSLFEQYEDTSEYGAICPFAEDKYWAAFTCYCS